MAIVGYAAYDISYRIHILFIILDYFVGHINQFCIKNKKFMKRLGSSSMQAI